MILTFCGHADFQRTEEYERKMLSLLEEIIGDKSAELYFGGYGNFDAFAYECGKKYKRTHPNITLIFVSPYITPEYQRNTLEHLKNEYDAILYPELEDKPLRFAISYRNKYMVEKADCVIAYIDQIFGGAYTTYKHAKKMQKSVFNLGKVQ